MLPRALAAGGAGARTEQPVASEHPSPAMVVDGHDSSAEGAMMALSAYDVTVGTTARPACVPREHHRLRAMARQRTRRTACSGSARSRRREHPACQELYRNGMRGCVRRSDPVVAAPAASLPPRLEAQATAPWPILVVAERLLRGVIITGRRTRPLGLRSQDRAEPDESRQEKVLLVKPSRGLAAFFYVLPSAFSLCSLLC